MEWCFGAYGNVEIGIGLAAAAAPVFLAMSLLPECHRWSQRAIAALDDTTRGEAEEMQLQAGLGVASMHIHGQSEAARAALNRSLAIAEARGNVFSQVAMLTTLSVFCARSAEFKTTLDHAKRARAIAETIDEPDATALAQLVLGTSLHFIGDLNAARPELEAAFQHWSSTPRRYLGFDDRILVGPGLARTLWLQGLPAQALERTRQTINDAKLSGNPTSLAFALSWVPSTFIRVGDLRSAEQHADWLIPYAESHSLDPFLQIGHSYKAILAICSGDAKAGVESLRNRLKHLDAMHYKIRNTEFNIFLTQGLMAIGRADEGMALIDETIRRVEENCELYFLPEALRVKGCAILASPESRADDAEACFRQSLELSRRQGAKAWELRTATDLAALWAGQGRADDARALLLPVFEQFTEGFDTVDLKAAERLLTTLS